MVYIVRVLWFVCVVVYEWLCVCYGVMCCTDCFLHHLTWMDYRMVLLVPLGEDRMDTGDSHDHQPTPSHDTTEVTPLSLSLIPHSVCVLSEGLCSQLTPP